MHLVALAWMYVVLLMAAAEASSPNGSLVGALFTVLLYGVLPLSIVLYLLAAPLRRKARRSASAADPHRRGEAPGEPVAPVREEP